MNRGPRSAVSAVIPAATTFAASALGALIYIKTLSTAGGHFDLPWFFGWTGGLSLLTILLDPLVPYLGARSIVSLAMAVAVGCAAGILWSCLPVLLFTRAGAVPFYLIWPAAAAAGLASGVSDDARVVAPRRTVAFVAIAAVTPSLYLTAEPFLRGWQDLSVVGIRVVRPSATLEIANPAYLSPADLTLLRQSGVTGVLEVQHTMGPLPGLHPLARILLVSTAPLASEVTMAQPDRTEVVLVQNGDRLSMFPSNVRTHRFLLRLTPTTGPSAQTITAFVQQRDKNWSGAGVITWPVRPSR